MAKSILLVDTEKVIGNLNLLKNGRRIISDLLLINYFPFLFFSGFCLPLKMTYL